MEHASNETVLASTSYHHMSTVSLIDAGNTVLAIPQPGGIVDLDGRQYVLEQVHCHTPAEHVVDGHCADLEAHLVHRSSEGHLAVLAVLFDAQPGPNPIDAFIHDPGGPPTTERLDYIVPRGSTSFRYLGTLTTPPYTPGVQWVVFTHRLAVGSEALAAFADRYGPNNRALQQVHPEESITLG